MDTFGKKLEDAPNEELMNWINTGNIDVVPLASDELTRRRLKELLDTIKELDKNTMNYSGKLIDLTILLFFVAMMQIVVSVMSIPESWFIKILLGGTFFYGIYYLLRRMSEKKSRK